MKILTLSLIFLNIHFIAISQTDSKSQFEPEPFDYAAFMQKKKGFRYAWEALSLV